MSGGDDVIGIHNRSHANDLIAITEHTDDFLEVNRNIGRQARLHKGLQHCLRDILGTHGDSIEQAIIEAYG